MHFQESSSYEYKFIFIFELITLITNYYTYNKSFFKYQVFKINLINNKHLPEW